MSINFGKMEGREVLAAVTRVLIAMLRARDM